MFKPYLLSSAVAASLIVLGHNAIAQEADADKTQEGGVEVIQVSGIRGSLVKAIDIKREKIELVDSIVAEDIGKLSG